MAKKQIKPVRAVSKKAKQQKKSDWWTELWGGDKTLALSITLAAVVGLLIVFTQQGVTGKAASITVSYSANMIENGNFENGLDGWMENGVGSWRIVYDKPTTTNYLEQVSRSQTTGLYQGIDSVGFGAYMVKARVRAVGDSRCSVYIRSNSGESREIRSTSNQQWTLLTNTNICDENSDCVVVTYSPNNDQNTCQFDDIKVTRYN